MQPRDRRRIRKEKQQIVYVWPLSLTQNHAKTVESYSSRQSRQIQVVGVRTFGQFQAKSRYHVRLAKWQGSWRVFFTCFYEVCT